MFITFILNVLKGEECKSNSVEKVQCGNILHFLNKYID